MAAAPDAQTVGHVYRAITAIQAELATVGISKNRRNQQQGYQFRGIDDVFNSLAPLLAKHGLCMLPNVLAREMAERETKSGGVLFSVVLVMEFVFISALDASQHTIRIYGEAMDSGDKATNKAMSAAYKYAALLAFGIPTEGDNDADATTHDVKAKREAPTLPQATAAAPAPGRPQRVHQPAVDEGGLLLRGANKGKHISELDAETFAIMLKYMRDNSFPDVSVLEEEAARRLRAATREPGLDEELA